MIKSVSLIGKEGFELWFDWYDKNKILVQIVDMYEGSRHKVVITEKEVDELVKFLQQSKGEK